MFYSIAKPSLQLSKYVKHYWAIDSCIPESVNFTQRIIPNGLPELIFYFGDNRSGDNSLLSGQLNKYHDINISGKISVFAVLFQPHGLPMFQDVPVTELFNSSLPYNDIIKNKSKEIENRISEAKSFFERVRIIENFLLNQAEKFVLKTNFNRIEESINIINKTKGNVSVDFLAASTCLSRKQFERTFSGFTGISPKQFLKVIRFQNVLNQKRIAPNASLTQLSIKSGYYDQSHMINDFYRFSGMSPKQFFSKCEPFSDYFL